ncbi:toll/interleukin-1 receptor domain-containing protein [Nocardia farcinica]|uniref:tetratricopeptide repeat protein n=1 Tax=Nocardia TaxID=1817 RepID=UPI001894F84B|nr:MULTISPECIES: toll/interleukin-1 receptor domain-containing protein [Nocardia]MBF6290040.1 toll/interleukin-1 receptor domain-containing protein [Nocardia cyriacigeorgica]MBF6422259.1 toll/interleukin-1 receptor domain-containing protein [Nocardia farcinica]MBF6433915.1 toll/interleukin-1 receptor domain-containing protein [Nocardia farcinica]MBF6504983.1 toll/interleukin-1 receptor domain-containing protein [Nocardia farcinica]
MTSPLLPTAAPSLYDVFLCYKFEDFAAAEALRAELVARGLRVFLDVVTGEDWAPLSPSIAEALARSRTLVALITENFARSPHCREELHVALLAAEQLDAGDTSRVMAIVRGISFDDVRPKQLTAHRLPFGGLPPAVLVEKIITNVRSRTGVFGDAGTEMPHVKWYPRERPTERFFRGRYAELWEIHSGLRARERNRDRGLPVVSVTGAGGLGKTSLCLHYARVFGRDHPGGVFVLDFGGSGDHSGTSTPYALRSRFEEHLVMIAERLGVAGSGDVAAGLEALDLPYLWILDDIPTGVAPDHILSFVAPTRAGRTLITTRNPERFASATVALGPLDPESAARILTAYQPPAAGESSEVDTIVSMLGQHPLGLTIAAGLTTTADFTGYADLLTVLTSVAPDELEMAQATVGLPAGCAVPFSRVLLRSFHSLDKAGHDVVLGASTLAAAPIPRVLLTSIVSSVAGADERQVAEGISSASKRALLEADGSMYRMHALITRAIRLLVGTAGRRRFRDAAAAELTAAVEGTHESGRYPHVREYLPHVRAVAGFALVGDRWQVGEKERNLLNEAGRVHIDLDRRALEIYQLLYDSCSIETVGAYTHCVALNGLAVAHEFAGEHAVAAGLNERVVDLLREVCGENELETLTAVTNLAVLQYKMGLHHAAYETQVRVYRGRRQHRSLGPMHRETVVAWNNLAIFRGRLGTSPRQRSFHRRVAHRLWILACNRWPTIARPDDRDAIDALQGLGLSYRALGEHGMALPLLTDVYQRRTQMLGSEHPDTMDALENMLIVREELNERRG